MKTDLVEKMKYIETNYLVENIELQNVKLWPFLRSYIFSSYFYSDEKVVYVSFGKIISKIKKLFKCIYFTSFSIILKKNAVLIFTSDLGVKKNKNSYIDTTMQVFLKLEDKSIPIVFKYFSKNVFPIKKYIDSSLFDVCIKIIKVFCKVKKNEIFNKNILDEIISELKIDFNYLNNVKTVIAAIKFYKVYFYIIKPKAIYISCYYDLTTMAAIYVAKKMGVLVIEQQHGIIAKRHYAYMTFKKISDNPYPNYIFVYGDYYKTQISSFIYKKDCIFSVGNYYIDLMLKQENLNKKLFRNKYGNITNKFIITVASQYDVDKNLLSFIESVVALDDNLYFIFIPRFINDYHKNYNHQNISIETELDVYKCMQNSVLSSTVYSTCAIESLAFGVPVILINIDNLAKFGFKDFFGDTNSVFYVDTPEEYIELVYRVIKLNREFVKADGKQYFLEGYCDNVIKWISNIQEKNNDK